MRRLLGHLLLFAREFWRMLVWTPRQGELRELQQLHDEEALERAAAMQEVDELLEHVPPPKFDTPIVYIPPTSAIKPTSSDK